MADPVPYGFVEAVSKVRAAARTPRGRPQAPSHMRVVDLKRVGRYAARGRHLRQKPTASRMAVPPDADRVVRQWQRLSLTHAQDGPEDILHRERGHAQVSSLTALLNGKDQHVQNHSSSGVDSGAGCLRGLWHGFGQRIRHGVHRWLRERVGFGTRRLWSGHKLGDIVRNGLVWQFHLVWRVPGNLGHLEQFWHQRFYRVDKLGWDFNAVTGRAWLSAWGLARASGPGPANADFCSANHWHSALAAAVVLPSNNSSHAARLKPGRPGPYPASLA